MRFSALFALGVPAILLSGCNGLLPTDCTLIDCDDGLSVELAAIPTGTYQVEVLLPTGEIHAAECPDTSRCGPGIFFFSGVTAAEVTIRVTTEAGTRSETVRPRYLESRPNGPGCPPLCRQARVTVGLPT